tara:strand:- start:8 stop:649 length:642 start_codon:yes stop_codon:yes gene_type:complete
MPVLNKQLSGYNQIIKKRGLKSLFHELIDNYFFDLFYNVETQFRDGVTNKFNNHYAPTYYSLIKEAFNVIENKNKLNFIDVGCGKGKVLLVASDFGFKKIIGIDLSKKLLHICKQNIYKYKQLKYKKKLIKLINIEATKYKITNENVFYFFDPFSGPVLNTFLKNILLSFKKNKRKIYIIFANPPKQNKLLNLKFKKIKVIKRNTYNCNIYRL